MTMKEIMYNDNIAGATQDGVIRDINSIEVMKIKGTHMTWIKAFFLLL
jgi:arginine repressor